MSMMPSNVVIKSALSHRVITYLRPVFTALLLFPLHGTYSTCLYSVSNGFNSVENPFNMTNFRQL